MGNCVRCQKSPSSRSTDVIAFHAFGGYTSFHHAAWNGELDEVKRCLRQKGFDYDQQTDDKNTPFALAAHGDNLEVFEILLELGVNIHNADHESDTPLHYAAMNKSMTMAKKLIDHGADVNVKNRFGTTPLWLAVFHGDIDMLKLLLYNHADASMTECSTGARLLSSFQCYRERQSPLYVAIDKCHEDCVRLLISAGCDVNREEWFQEGRYPTRDEDNGETERNEESRIIQKSISFLNELASRPQSLISICRTFLRHRLGKRLNVVVRDLGIPNTLVDYVTLAEFK
ncbi:hypothetical protein FSP39_010563 [Pinctada imbricata]|uniref:SOCS box domain-containing protein n=1 Tax=Pinctada imbricata TaxID=66713 RepID=A0AA89BW63_PINIB|nr:hypothetical protein FSP39_010563 [Pinctada imbricata]